MFDHIGRENDPNAARRRALSAFITVSAAGSLGFIAGISALLIVDAPLLEAEPETEMAMMVELADPLADEAPPPAPPIARGRESVVPETAPEDPSELPTEIPTETITQTAPIGSAQGTDNGTEDGEIGGKDGGVPGGSPQGTGTKVGGTGPVRVQHTELQIVRQFQPRYPKAAMGLGNERCVAEIVIDTKGKPVSVVVTQCDEAFHPETITSLMKWRFRPHKVAGRSVVSRTSVGIKYLSR